MRESRDSRNSLPKKSSPLSSTFFRSGNQDLSLCSVGRRRRCICLHSRAWRRRIPLLHAPRALCWHGANFTTRCNFATLMTSSRNNEKHSNGYRLKKLHVLVSTCLFWGWPKKKSISLEKYIPIWKEIVGGLTEGHCTVCCCTQSEMGSASCQFYVGGADGCTLHLCFVKRGKQSWESGMKGAPNDIAEIALPRTSVRPSSICVPLGQLPCHPTSRQSKAERKTSKRACSRSGCLLIERRSFAGHLRTS